MNELPHTRWCFVCVESNPRGLNLRSETDGRTVQLRFLPRPEHIGFAQTVHGGIVASVLDEVMVWACAVQTSDFVGDPRRVLEFMNDTGRSCSGI